MPAIQDITATLQTIAAVDNWKGLRFRPNGNIEKQGRCQLFGKIFCCNRFRPHQEIPQLKQTITTLVETYKKGTKDLPSKQLTLIQATVTAYNTYIGFLNQQKYNIDLQQKLDVHNLLGANLEKVLKARQVAEWLKKSAAKKVEVIEKEGETTQPTKVKKEGDSPKVTKKEPATTALSKTIPEETAETTDIQQDWDSDEDISETQAGENSTKTELPNVKDTFGAVQIEGQPAVLTTAPNPLVVTEQAATLANKMCENLDNVRVLRNRVIKV
jgi:hypothetical protein